MTRGVWRVDVHGWGTLYARGTEEQAEEWRRHKARWEGAHARKRLATDEETTNAREVDDFDRLIDPPETPGFERDLEGNLLSDEARDVYGMPRRLR